MTGFLITDSMIILFDKIISDIYVPSKLILKLDTWQRQAVET
jgi:hypothetical protein